jgi:hypothetical protein
MKTSHKTKALFLGISITLLLIGCHSGPEELVNYKGSDYHFRLEVSDNYELIKRSSTIISSNDISFEKIPLKECLSVLLEKNKSLIKFKDPEKEDLMITAKYEDFQKRIPYKENINTAGENYKLNVKSVKKALLPIFTKAMNITIIEKEDPAEKNYQLVVIDSIKQKKNLSKTKKGLGNSQPKESSTVTNFPETLICENCTITQIADGLNKSYGGKAYFVGDINDKNRYTFEISNIPFDQLKKQLENEIGLSYVQMGQGKTSLNISTIVFND